MREDKPSGKVVDVPGTSSEPAYDSGMEDRIFRKITLRLIPLMFVLYVISYLDRINVGFAALQMNEHFGFSASVYGLGGGMFFIGYFLFEIPGNLILERVGARLWIARIMVSWGLAASAMMLIQGQRSFYILRFLLGLSEAGFFPGMILYLTYWFPRRRVATTVALFMTATAISGVVGGPISGLLLTMHGMGGLLGWQWLFLLEGVPAIVFGVIVYFYLPDGPDKAVWLTEEEKRRVTGILRAERDEVEMRHSIKTFVEVAGNARVWVLSLIYFTIVIGLYSLSLWLPLMIKGFAHTGDLRVGFISAVPYLCAAVGMVAIGARSDRRLQRRPLLAGSLAIGAAGFVLSAFLRNPVLELAALSMAAVGVWGTFGPFWSLPASFLRGSAAAGGIALINSVGNLGGFAGPYIVGVIKDATKSFEYSLLALSMFLVLGIVLTAQLRRD